MAIALGFALFPTKYQLSDAGSNTDAVIVTNKCIHSPL